MTIVRHGLSEPKRLFNGWSMFLARTLLTAGMQTAIFRNAKGQQAK